ncbi:MAG TPA: LacI family DNA-binding transcriptional regulator [Acidobacteriaceae bacterium]|nr:LacI family DNA-binding transcriptional regulator [Acidobacteriaceae bacterium]
MIRNPGPPTLVDVAREAGVSLKTASRVLGDEPYVSEKTAARVRAAMASLGYQPNELARGLKARRSAAIGMVVPNVSDPFTANAVKAVQEAARANGHIVILACSGLDCDIERSEIQSLVGRQIDGLVISPADNRRDNVTGIVPPHLPVVTYDKPINGAGYDLVTIPNRRSAKEAVQHLLSHGYKRVVAIGARPALYTGGERFAGYNEAMKKAGLESLACPVDSESQITPEWLAQVVLKRNRADAIICLNFLSTMQTMRAMCQLGKRLGDDIPFLAFDDFYLADLMIPTLSVVRQPAERFGAESARLLFERIRGAAAQERRSIVLPTELILRKSCGC